MGSDKITNKQLGKRDDPYCNFRNDKYRFMALVVREVCGVGRYVILFVAACYYGVPLSSPMFAAFLAKL